MLFSSDLCYNGLRCALGTIISKICIFRKRKILTCFFFSDDLFIVASLCYHKVAILGMRYQLFFPV